MTRAARPGSGLEPGVLVVLLVFTLASALAINPYYYGTGDNSITIPFLKASIDPGLYPGDYLLAQRPYYYTYLWDALGALHTRLGVDLPSLFFSTYLAALFLTFLGMYRIAVTLFGSREAAILSLVFLVFSKSTLAGVQTVEGTLATRAVATPLLLLAVVEFLRRNTVRSFLLLGLAYLVHPLTTHYVLTMLVVAGLVESRRRGLRSLAAGISLFLLVSSPLLIWRFRHTPPSLHLFSADPEWLVALHERSPHHMFPSTWGWTTLAHVLVVLVLFGIAWWHRNRDREDRHRVIVIASAVILAWCAFGVVGSELRPVGLAFVSQPLRAFQFMEYFAMLYVANDFYRRMAEAPRFVTALGATAIAGWIFFDADRPVVAVLVLVAIAAWMTAGRRVLRRDLTGSAFLATAACVVGVAACACVPVDHANGDETFSLVDDIKPPWRDVQRWAQAHTEVRDAFIVPPDEPAEFRVHGERTVYADREDGGLMNANPAFGTEWLRRMRMLGFAAPDRAKPDFCRLDPAQARRVAAEMKGTHAKARVFLVWPCGGRLLPFREAYRNPAYVVYEVI